MEHIDHSKAYIDFYRFLNAAGMESAYGTYSPDTLDEIYDWERDEVEETIWQEFKSYGNLPDLASKLQKYDGIEALNEKLREGISNSGYSYRMVDIARTLYEVTSNEDYLDYIFEYYDKKKDSAALAVLSHLKPCKKLYEFFKDVYLNSDESVARSTAVDGMLYCKGYIKDPNDLQEMGELVGMGRAFISDDRKLRKKKLARFENGDFDNIPRTYGLCRRVSYEDAIRLAKEKKPMEDPGEIVTGIIDATQSDVYIVFCESDNTYNLSDLSKELDGKPSVGDKVRLLKKQKGRSVILSI